MARTITQIMGDYGLDGGSDKDIFANTEASTLKTVTSVLNELNSNQNEIAAAKGFGRSSFTDASLAKQQNDIINPVLTQFAQARLNNDLNQAQFNRSVIGQGVQADIASQQADQSLTNTLKTMNEQYNLGEQQANTSLQRQKDLNAATTENTASLYKTQAQLDSEKLAKQSELNKEYLKSQTEANLQLSNDSFAKTQQLNQQQSELNSKTLQQQADIRSKEIEQQAQVQIENLKQQASIQSASMDQQAELNLRQIDQQFQNKLEELQRTTDLQMQNLPEELRLKAQYQKSLLEDQIAVQRQTALDNVVISTIAGTVQNTLSSFGITGLNNTINSVGDALSSIKL